MNTSRNDNMNSTYQNKTTVCKKSKFQKVQKQSETLFSTLRADTIQFLWLRLWAATCCCKQRRKILLSLSHRCKLLYDEAVTNYWKSRMKVEGGPIDSASQVYRSFISLVRCKNRAEGLVVNRSSLSYDLSWVKGCRWKGQDENVGLHHLMAVYLCFALLCIPVAAPFPPHLILHTLETDSACFTFKLLEKEKPKRFF